MELFENILEDCQKQVAQGASQEKIIANLYTQGVNIIESMKIIRELYHIPLIDAKRIVRAHPAWASFVQSWDPILAAFIEEVEEELAMEAKESSHDS
ncbi:hypothetical protein KDA_13390 [Dictyobacter alpinus]|uniref:Uncharacterized protein n=1 Tax=Dictyobacter alpinus TaxID=2014873 RepID=A0A402B3D1_9CHLR|nr:hypothetical protein [Dictyobacter alpinus]GCE25855.1 hypothetical protein KDA_13390 [Dictyobacter alpinus]